MDKIDHNLPPFGCYVLIKTSSSYEDPNDPEGSKFVVAKRVPISQVNYIDKTAIREGYIWETGGQGFYIPEYVGTPKRMYRVDFTEKELRYVWDRIEVIYDTAEKETVSDNFEDFKEVERSLYIEGDWGIYGWIEDVVEGYNKEYCDFKDDLGFKRLNKNGQG